MTFEGKYLTKQEYLDLGGSSIEDMPFNLLEFEARRMIDIKTFNRLVGGTEIPQEVKLCEYELINKIQSYINVSNEIGNVSSENTDGYSVSYITIDRISDIVKSKKNDLDDVIYTYLINVVVDNEHIMYVGVK